MNHGIGSFHPELGQSYVTRFWVWGCDAQKSNQIADADDTFRCEMAVYSNLKRMYVYEYDSERITRKQILAHLETLSNPDPEDQTKTRLLLGFFLGKWLVERLNPDFLENKLLPVLHEALAEAELAIPFDINRRPLDEGCKRLEYTHTPSVITPSHTYQSPIF